MKLLISLLIFSLPLSGCLTSKASSSASNSAPSLNSRTIDATINKNQIITLGPLLDNDNDPVTYTASSSDHCIIGPNENQITYKNDTFETEILAVQATDGLHETVHADFTINVTTESPSNFITGRDIILPNFGSTPPEKGESRVDPTTGAKITRLTNVSELDGTNEALIVYSRYTPENSSGKLFLVFGGDSHSSWVVNRETGEVVNKLIDHNLKNIGETHEIRWDLSGNHPNRIYYRYGIGLYKIDDVTIENPIATLVKDFSSELPEEGIYIYNDVEGDSSNDSDHWAFMAAHYDKASNETKGIVAFVHYQISTDTVHVLRPSDLAGAPDATFQIKTGEPMAKNDISDLAYFPIKPNMVEVSPLGTGLIIHNGRTWWENNTTSGTWFDGPHLWPLDLDWKTSTPIRIAQDESHSGWAFDENGLELFVNQDNRRDL